MIDRRGFLVSLLASAVATGLPKFSADKRDAIVERLASAIQVSEPAIPGSYFDSVSGLRSFAYVPKRLSNGDIAMLTSDGTLVPLVVTVADMGDGFISAHIRTVCAPDTISVSIASGNKDGLFFGAEHHIREYLEQNQTHIAANGLSVGRGFDSTLWMRV